VGPNRDPNSFLFCHNLRELQFQGSKGATNANISISWAWAWAEGDLGSPDQSDGDFRSQTLPRFCHKKAHASSLEHA
jgi:hypothetical protein